MHRDTIFRRLAVAPAPTAPAVPSVRRFPTDFEFGLDWSRTEGWREWASAHGIEPKFVYGLSFALDQGMVEVYEFDRDEDGQPIVVGTGRQARLKKRRPYRVRILELPPTILGRPRTFTKLLGRSSLV